MTNESKPPPSPQTSPLSSGRKLAFSLIVVALAVGSVELACRLFGLGRTVPVESCIAVWNRAPDGRDFWAIRGRDYNADGVRDREHRLEKAPGTIRIACIGDSVTMGYKLTVRDAFPYLLERRLQAAGLPAEVFNIALPGWSTRQHVQAYRKIARKYAPDLVLLGVCLNDIPEMHNNLVGPPSPLIGILVRHSAFVRWLIQAERRQVHEIEELFVEPLPSPVQSGYDAFYRELLILRNEVVADGRTFAIVLFPFRIQLAPDAPPPRPQHAISQFAAHHDIACLDVLPTLRSSGTDTFLDESHLSRRGAQIVADEIMGWLRSGRFDLAPEGGGDDE